MNALKKIALVSTGGTIEKTYDELSGILDNNIAVLDVMLSQLQLLSIELDRIRLMNKDSLDMTVEDHILIATTSLNLAKTYDGVVVVHGTDRLANTGAKILELNKTPSKPIVLTGAMRPFELKNTDALQNLTEAFLAVQIVRPGVYVAMHNKVLRFPGVIKDKTQGTFVLSPSHVLSPSR